MNQEQLKTMDVREALRLLEAIKAYQKHDPASGAVEPNLADTGGIFSDPYSDPNVISAIQAPATFWSRLPLVKSNVRNEVSKILTAQEAETGENPDDICGLPMNPGGLLMCRVKTTWGKLYLGTPKVDLTELNIVDSYGVRPTRVLNTFDRRNPWLPEILLGEGVNFNSKAAELMFRLANQTLRSLAYIEVRGDSTLTAGSRRPGWIEEFDGVATQMVAITDINGEACPAASPEIIAWNAAYDAAADLVRNMHDVYYSRRELADEVGMGDTEWAFLMDKRLFRRMTYLWACTYASSRCSDDDAGQPILRDMGEINRRAEDMFRGKYFLIDGEQVPVLFTGGKEVTTTTATYSTSFWLIAMRGGGMNLAYIEYNPFDAEAISGAVRDFGLAAVRVLNNGLYIVSNKADPLCFQVQQVTMPRLMLKARFLGAVWNGVTFTNITGFRNWDPAGTEYEGGGTDTFDSGL